MLNVRYSTRARRRRRQTCGRSYEVHNARGNIMTSTRLWLFIRFYSVRRIRDSSEADAFGNAGRLSGPTPGWITRVVPVSPAAPRASTGALAARTLRLMLSIPTSLKSLLQQLSSNPFLFLPMAQADTGVVLRWRGLSRL